ncbi:MAG: hypothetical protein LKG27_06260 [Clostridiaceae bacterium]|jgi:hypothetical protein|nr:hypothetical protein [Clostridiaceae bacterium]
MSNFTIPYAFTPGTKAKASEVNANFAAVAQEIVDFKTNVTTQFETVDTKITDSISDKSDNYLSEAVNITNGILVAPNGVATYATNIITVKSGIKVRVPNGRNADATLNNTTYTLPNDITLDMGSITEEGYLFLASDGTLSHWAKKDVGFVYKAPASNFYWMYYDSDLNCWKYTTNGTDYKVYNGIIIAEFKSASGVVNYLKSMKPIELLKFTDKSKIIDWNSVDYSAGIDVALPYTASRKGQLIIGADDKEGTYFRYIYINGIPFTLYSNSYASNVFATIFLNEGDTISSTLYIYTSRFYPLKGAE